MPEAKTVMKRKRWLLALIGVGGLMASLGALVALAPALVSAGLFRGSIESAVGGAIDGTARIGSLSLSWFGRQQVSGLELRDGKGETDIKLDLTLDNALFDLAVGSVDALRATVSGSVQARVLPGGGTSLSNLSSSGGAPVAAKTAPAKSSGNPLAALPFPVKLTIGSFDATLAEGQGTAFAVRGLRGSVSVGRAEPLAIDLSATTQVGDRGGSLSVKGTLDRFLTGDGAFDLQEMTGELDAEVAGWLLAAAGVNAEVQAAALRLQAPAGKPLGVAVNAAVRVADGVMSAQAQMTAARPVAGRGIGAWAMDPRTWIGQVALKGVPTASLQRLVADTPLVLAREIGPSVDVTLRTGEGAGVDLSATAANLQLVARAVVDAATGAMQGDGVNLRTAIDPALLAAFGTTVDAPVQVNANLASLRTPPVATGAFDVGAIAFDGTVQVQPFQMLKVGPQPIAFGALTIAAKADTIGTQVQASINGSVQQAPIDVQAQVTGLGGSLSFASAQVRGTVAAGPLDPTVLPALPAAARKWLGLVQPGATTLRASLAGSMQQGSAQAQLDMAPGGVALKAGWDAASVNVDQVQSTLVVQPALVGAFVGEAVALASPVQVQLAAGPLKAARSGASKFDPIPVRVQLPTVALARAPGLSGSASATDIRVQGAVDPDGPTLFDGSASIAGVNASAVQGVGPVQVQSVTVQAKLPSDWKSVAIDAKVTDVQCPRVPGVTGVVGVRDAQVTLAGPIDFGAGARASLKGTVRDGSGVIASLQGTLEPRGAGWRATVQSVDVDMRRALALVGQGEALPAWVGAEGQRSLSAILDGGEGGVSFGVNAALDPVSLQAQGTRTAAGAITLTKGSLEAKLPGGVAKSLVAQLGAPVTACDPLEAAVMVNALTLPVDAEGRLQPFAPGADIDLLVRVRPWRLSTRDAPSLVFGASELVAKTRAGAGASAKLTGSLGAEGTPQAPMTVSVQTANLLDEQGRLAIGQGSLVVAAHVKDFPTGLADRVAGMDGYLVDMLGSTFTVDLDGRSGKARDDFFKASFTSPTLTVRAPVVRLADRVLSIAPDAPLTAELRPDDRFKQRILKPVNPIFSDIKGDKPILATLSSIVLPLPVDMRLVDATLSIDIGIVEVQRRSELLSLVDVVRTEPDGTIPVKFTPLAARIDKGTLSYRDFEVLVGRVGADTWQVPLKGEGVVRLGDEPPYVDRIDILYPYGAVANTIGTMDFARSGVDEINRAVAAIPGAQKALGSLQIGVRFFGPLGAPGGLQRKMLPLKLNGRDLSEGLGDFVKSMGQDLGGTIRGIGDLFKKNKGN